MKKQLILIVLMFLIILYVMSSSGAIMWEIVSYRNDVESPLGSDKYKYGDLYGFSYLKDFRIRFCSDSTLINMTMYNNHRTIDLYMIHDSYLSPVYVKSDSIFCGVNKYYQFSDENNLIALDTTKTNILVIEIVERNLRKYAAENKNLQLRGSLYSNFKANAYISLKDAYRTVFNPNFDQNFEYNIFEYQFLTPLKEFRAEINYKLFNRVDPMVAVSSDKKYLYLAETIDTTVNTSSFNPIENKEIDEIIYVLNTKYRYYKSIGFKEVYFSIIPNPVTILNTENYKYNYLISKIQNNKNLDMPMIDIYSIFKQQTIQLYNRSDSHWTMNGFHLWMNELNKKLENLSNAASKVSSEKSN